MDQTKRAAVELFLEHNQWTCARSIFENVCNQAQSLLVERGEVWLLDRGYTPRDMATARDCEAA